jgi:hypothetical protein
MSGTPRSARRGKPITRPTKLNDERREELLDRLRNGFRRMSACRSVGVAYGTFQEHVTRDPAFAEAVKLAEREANEAVEEALFDAAISGNVTACFGWLYNRDPEQWADRRNLRIGGADGGPVAVSFDADALEKKVAQVLAFREERALPKATSA